MCEVEKCPICGQEPGWTDFDIEAKIEGGERSYFHCGFKASTKKLWNKYAAAMRFAKLTALMDAGGGYTPDTAVQYAKWKVLDLFGIRK